MNDAGEEGRVDRLRDLATRIVERVGGLPAVKLLVAVLDNYDAGGGGLVAGGLAYSALLALLPGLLLVLSVVAVLIDSPAARDQIVAWIGQAVPPLEDLARTALEQVSAGAVPTGIVAIVGLLWGSSRFYAALDNAISRIFHKARRRNEIERTVRGLIVSGLFVATPLAALLTASVVSWIFDATPVGPDLGGVLKGLWQLASPLGSFVLFVGVTALVYRFVPATRVPVRALAPPAVAAGLALAVIAQAFAFVAPRLAGVAALFGAFVAVFGLLAWLSISFNVLLLGAAWTRVRLLAIEEAGEHVASRASST
jgi:membrane protein